MEQNTEPKNEPVVTAAVALEFIAGLILAVSGLVALFALIWAKWSVFRVSLTVFVSVVLLTAFGYYIDNHIRRNAK